jgi:2-keto-4-pentenoate hydratase/2-oxohepta-3-ene-1,7-dioic acid hydratase in catechol pathway
MRLVSFGPAGVERPGLQVGAQILDLRAALARRGHYGISTLTDLISLPYWRRIAQLLADEAGEEDLLAPGGQRLGAPIPRPGKVIVIGGNTYSHIQEAAIVSRGVPPLRPMAIAKAPTAVVGPGDDVVCPRGAQTVDYEVELGVVIGSAARHVTAGDALSVVAGFTVVNEMSDRDLQIAAHEDNDFYRGHYLGKSYDGFCPAGPALVTPDELDDLRDPASIRLRTWVNDDLRQDADLTDLCFSVAELVAYLSTVMTLLPGDLICTGSPAGVGAFQQPPAYLSPGDIVRTEITGLGGTTTRIVADPRDQPAE